MYAQSSFARHRATWIICALALALSVAVTCASDPVDAKADAAVSRLRELPVPIPSCEVISAGGMGGPCPSATLREQLYSELRALDGAAVRALSQAFDSPDVLLKQNVASALETLGGGYDTYKGYGELHGVDISDAIPGLLKGLSDSDGFVRAWSAQALSHVGPKGAPAVPKLIDMLQSDDEGDRNSSCIGLRGIGSGAKAALPALKSALLDRSEDVRHFASLAIESIE